jgi:pyruvate formate lyase activating enzyme
MYIRRETNVWLEITTLLIPGENDSPEEIDAMTKWIAKELGADVPLHFTAFHPDYKMMDYPPTPPATLTRARDIAIRNGLQFVYTGNVHDESGGSTYCPSCGKRVIGRDWYEITAWHLDRGGRCSFCGATIAGLFEAGHGDWGAKRLPIAI